MAFRHAAALAPDSPRPPSEGWRVGVCNARGQVAARGAFRSFNQLCSFVLALENTGGYQALLFCDAAVELACDVVLHPLGTPPAGDSAIDRRF